jgi:histone-binding protein RBBP4
LIICKARIPTQEYTSDVKDKPDPNSANNNRFEIETRINHTGEINKARINPKKSNIIATKTTSGEVYLFNYHKHPPKPTDNICKPDHKLVGHSKEGYALNWSNLKENYLISGADDNKVIKKK